MRAYLDWMNKQPRVVKIILCIWILDITWALYRIFGAIQHKNWFRLVLAILWIVAAGTVGWVLDIIWIIIFGHIFWWVD